MRRRAALLGIVGILLGSGKAAIAGEWSPEYRAALARTARKRREFRRRQQLAAAKRNPKGSGKERERRNEDEREDGK